MPVLLAVNLISIFGFATFVMHPELLARYSWAPPIFAVSYRVFAQLQIALAFAILARRCQKGFGWRWLKLFIPAALISFSMEYLSTTYGLPFGHYSYTPLLGWKIAGQVPVLIPLSWFFMSLPSFLLADQILGTQSTRLTRIVLGSLLLLSWDLTLDPAMSSLTPFWIWESSSTFFLQIPVKNLAGWFLTGCLILWVYDLFSVRINEGWKRDQFALKFYAANLLLPLGISFFGKLWSSIVATTIAYILFAVLARATGGSRNFRTAP